ncbi:calphotin-like [Macrobrachium rosenbergii]|uniref:calphotin-like n=1 Tax=Macrobrachium rosenbergii TaxID=79674 RepID=UPI0034D6A2B1
MKIIFLVLSVLVVTWAHPAADGFGDDDSSEETPGNLDDTFQFAYAVASPEHGTFHGHQSTRDEAGHTSGSYYSLGADGHWRQTIYADKGLGFQALSNQRPAGSPPPQVSAVNYQIFVHPGATAVSASGSGPIDTEALIGQPVASAAPIAAPQVSFDVRNEANEHSFPQPSGSSAAAPAPVLPSSLSAAAALTAPAAAIQTSTVASVSPVVVAQTGAVPVSPVSVSVQQATPSPISFVTPAPPPVNVAVQAAPQPTINVQQIPLAPIDVRLQAAPSPTINVQTPQPPPVSVRLQATPAPPINIQAARPPPVNIAIRNQAPGPITLQTARPSPVNVAVLGSPQGSINVHGVAHPPLNAGVRAAPSGVRQAVLSPINLAGLTSPAGPVTVGQGAPINLAVRTPSSGSVLAGGAGPVGGFQNTRRGVVAATTIPVGGLSVGSRGSFARGIPFGTRLVGSRPVGNLI